MWRALPESSRTASYASALSLHGATLVDSGEHRAAEPSLREALAFYEAHRESAGHRLGMARARLAGSLAGQRRWPEAAELMASALPALAPTPYGWGDRHFARFQLVHARTLLELGRARDASAALAELRTRLTPAQATAWPEVVAELGGLAARLR